MQCHNNAATNMLSGIMLSVIIMNVIMLSANMLSGIMLCVISMNVIMLSVNIWAALCWVLLLWMWLCWMPICWVALCWVLLLWMSLCLVLLYRVSCFIYYYAECRYATTLRVFKGQMTLSLTTFNITTLTIEINQSA
jgi:hypothetical protein